MDAATAQQNLTDLKSAISKGSDTFVTIKPQYTGSWCADINQISRLTGVTNADILKANQWLNKNNFTADNSGYVVLRLSGSSKGSGGTSSSVNDVPTGYYATNSWVFPLGVGQWYCSTGYKAAHRGLDLTTGVPGRIAGSPIYASKAGTVVQNYSSDSWGNTILIRHDETADSDGNCYYTRYAHMISQATQAVGTKVSQGDKVGTVGNTGKSTGYHLHFQIYYASATRTDYTSFNATADFSVDPNTIADFPGNPWKESSYSTVDYTKSEYVTEDDLKIIIGATKGDGTVSQSEFDETVNTIANRICEAQNVKAGSTLETIVKDFVKKQLNGLKEKGEEAVLQLISGGNFYAIFDNFCESAVTNAIWYIQSKVGEQLVTAEDKFVSQTKESLKSWVFSATNLDPNDNTAKALGVYLDSYVDKIVQNGWSAVTTAINTKDVATACEVFFTDTKNDSIDFMCSVTAHGAATAITAYIPTVIDDTNGAQIVMDLTIGVTNVTIQSIGGVLKGQISIAQAGKNILSQAVISITTTVTQQYLAPYLKTVISGWASTAITAGLEAIGISLGGAGGAVVAAILSTLVTLIVDRLLDFLLQKLVGFFTQ